MPALSTEGVEMKKKPRPEPKIKCQACDGTGPCGTCGGYGIVLQRVRCRRCGSPRWERPGCFTVYEGKTWTSVDGVTVTYHTRAPDECSKCPPEMRVERA